MVAAGQVLIVMACCIAIYWVFRAPPYGVAIGTMIGVYFLGLGVAIWVTGGSREFVALDSVRGGLTIILGRFVPQVWVGRTR